MADQLPSHHRAPRTWGRASALLHAALKGCPTYVRRCCLAPLVLMAGIATPVHAQAPPAEHDHEAPAETAPEPEDQAPPTAGDHVGHGAPMMSTFSTRETSGTAWLPDTTPMYGIHHRAGSWQLMFHGNAFAQFLYESGGRGSEQAGSINWIMGMARRDFEGGRLGVRGMISLEPWTIPGCGYPDLLATGEVCEGETIHDRQHPHDLFMEVAAEYERRIEGSLGWQVYAGLAGEPALGPVAYPHRVSAMPNPLAPISHHWLDATHITFGVVTAALYADRWKTEISTFNGREPDEHRSDFDFGALDSVSGRVWFLPTPAWALQFSAGRLTDAEAGHELESRVDVDRVTASATYHRSLETNGLWASTLAWGMNHEEGQSTHALLMETTLTRREQDVWFGRLELAGKPAHDLDIDGTEDVFTVAKLQAGYTRYLEAWRSLQPGLGAGLSVGVVPASLEAAYGGRTNLGLAVFVTVRPKRHQM